MNPRQRRFVAEYIACRNATEAARRAGYSPAGSGAAGFKQLQKQAVLAALRAAGIDTGEGGAQLHPQRRDAHGLNPRQRRFVAEYQRSRNAKDAARRAGYAPGRAAHTGSALLRFKPVIAALRAAGVTIRYGHHPHDQQRAQRLTIARKALTPRQSAFVAHYLAHGKGSAAAIHAGYSKRNAATAAWQLLQRPLVAAAVAQERAKIAERALIDAERVLTEYGRVAFANIADIVDWGAGGTDMRLKDEISRDGHAALREISAETTENGTIVQVKMHSKLDALEALGKHLGLWEKRAPAEPSPAEAQEARAALRRRFLELVDEGVKAVLAARDKKDES